MKSTIRVLGVAICLAGIGYSGVQAKNEPSKRGSGVRTISYQGVLQEKGGRIADGTYTISATIFADAEGTTPIWVDEYEVVVTNGLYHLTLGSGKVPLPESSQLDRELWLGIGINGELMKPFTKLTAQPYALNVVDNSISTVKIQDGAITSEKIGTDYVKSIHINGQQVTGIGDEINIVANEGLSVSYDEASKSVVFKRESNRSGSGKNNTLADEVIDGNLTVNGNTDLGGYALDPTIKFTGRSVSDLNMDNNSLTKVQAVTMGNPGSSVSVRTHPQIGDRTVFIPSTSSDAEIVLTNGPQIINGNKTFSESTSFLGAVSIPNGPVTIPASSINNGYLENPVIIVNAGTGLTGGGYATLGGEITLENTGVITLTGTPEQINVSASSGNITLTGPQDLGPASSPTFENITATGKITAEPTTSSDPVQTLTTRDYVDGIAAVTKACAVADANTYTDQSVNALRQRTITAGSGLVGGGDLTADRTLSLASTGVAAGTYTNPMLTIDGQGRVTSASSQTTIQATTLQTTSVNNSYAGIKAAVNTGAPTLTLNVTVENTSVTSNSVVIVTAQDHLTAANVQYSATIVENGIMNGQFNVVIRRADNTMIPNGEGCKIHYIVVN